jgi:hypothetical protein
MGFLLNECFLHEFKLFFTGKKYDFMLVFQKLIPEMILGYKCSVNMGPVHNSYGYLKFKSDFHVTEF